jgi:hypothetical protein
MERENVLGFGIQESEWEKLKNKIWNELQKELGFSVAIGYNEEEEIQITEKGLKIILTKQEDYDYWTWEIETPSLKIFISTTNQSLFLFEKAKQYRVDAEININYSYVEQDLFICNNAEFAYEEILSIFQIFREDGEKGLFETFLNDYLYSLIS